MQPTGLFDVEGVVVTVILQKIAANGPLDSFGQREREAKGGEHRLRGGNPRNEVGKQGCGVRSRAPQQVHG